MVCTQCGKRTKEQVHVLCFVSQIPKIEEFEALPVLKKQVTAA